MVHSLYTRLLAFTSLLLVVGGFLFWLLAVKLDVPEPFSLIIAGVASLILAAVVIGVILHPVDEVHQALVRMGQGEEVPLPRPRADDMRPLVNALEQLHQRLAHTVVPGPAGLATNAALLGVLNSLSEGVAILDQDLKIVVINTSLRSMANIERVGPEDSAKLGEGLEKYRNAFNLRCFVPDQLALIEDEMRKKPDQPRTDIIQLEHPQQYIKRYGAPLLDTANQQIGFWVSYQDITHEVLMDKLRQDFIANASHELRTPVTSVKVLLENLMEGAKDDPAVRDEFISDAAREIDRMHDLVNELLDLAALESGRNQLELTTFDLKGMIEDAVSTVVPQAKQRDVALEVEAPSAAVPLEADKSRMRQVMVNLVANAVKFTPAGGQVKVRIGETDGQVRISVQDSGIGIPAKDLAHIFDRFFRVTRGRSRLQGGSGLGLTIVKAAIDAHRGDIGVESTEGQGTTFTITLPATQAQA
jgi:two-component system phosphate regulon sensor histidine kinase PhoR